MMKMSGLDALAYLNGELPVQRYVKSKRTGDIYTIDKDSEEIFCFQPDEKIFSKSCKTIVLWVKDNYEIWGNPLPEKKLKHLDGAGIRRVVRLLESIRDHKDLFDATSDSYKLNMFANTADDILNKFF